jgi:hypothetical protein
MNDELRFFAMAMIVLMVFIVSVTSCTIHENTLRTQVMKTCVERNEDVTDCNWFQRSPAR